MNEPETNRPGHDLRRQVFSSVSRFVPRLGCVLLSAAIVLPPLLYFSSVFLHPGEALLAAFTDRAETARLLALLLRSVWIALLGAAISSGFASIVFLAIQPLGRRTRNALWIASLLPLFIPAHFTAIAWIQTVGRGGWLTGLLRRAGEGEPWLPSLLYSSFGCAWILALHFFPIALTALMAGARSAGRAEIEAARTFMTPTRLWRSFLVTALRPWLAVAFLAVFILCLLDFSVASLLGRHVFTVEVMTAYNVYYDAPRAAGLSLPLIAVALAAAVVLLRRLSRLRWPAAASTPSEPPPAGGRASFGFSAAALIVSLAAGLPLVVFGWMSGGWTPYRTILISAGPQIVASVLGSALAAVLVAALGLGAVSMGRRRAPGGALLSAIMVGLFALPGSVVGMALINFWNDPRLGPIGNFVYDSGLALPLGFTTLFLPLVYFIVRARLGSTPAVMIELDRLNPQTPSVRWWTLTFPRAIRPVLLGSALVFVLAMQEVHASILLVAPGRETLSIRAFTLLHYAPDRLVAAFCLTTLVAMFAALLVAFGAAKLARAAAHKRFPDRAFD